MATEELVRMHAAIAAMAGQDLMDAEDAARVAAELAEAKTGAGRPVALRRQADEAPTPMAPVEIDTAMTRRCLNPRCDAAIDVHAGQEDGELTMDVSVHLAAMVAGYCCCACQRVHALSIVRQGRAWWQRSRS